MSYDGMDLTNAQIRTVLAARTGHLTSLTDRRALGGRPLAARVFRFTVDACPVAAVHPIEYRVVPGRAAEARVGSQLLEDMRAAVKLCSNGHQRQDGNLGRQRQL